MFVLSPAPFLALVLLAEPQSTAQPSLPKCEKSLVRIELPAEPTSDLPEVCISPELPTTFHFDSPLMSGSMELQGRERFEDVAPGTRSFTLFAPADLQTGERLKVVVRFSDGAAPTRATFMLVGHPAFGSRDVDVFRYKRTVEDYQRETREEREKSQRLSQELERVRLVTGPGGITELISTGMMDRGGIVVRELQRNAIVPPSNALDLHDAYSYRMTATHKEGEEHMVRVAVELKLLNPGPKPWTVRDAALVRKGQGAMPMKLVWQASPIQPGAVELALVVVELEMTARDARGTFTLKMWDESGSRLVTFGNVTFP
ncbi:MAG TPA: DUF2381 family protein [Archangium sp.]|nr:DUF2381 family protein [Archangium sp.]